MILAQSSVKVFACFLIFLIFLFFVIKRRIVGEEPKNSEKSKEVFFHKFIEKVFFDVNVCLCALWRTGIIKEKKDWERMVKKIEEKRIDSKPLFKISETIDEIIKELIQEYFEVEELLEENSNLRALSKIAVFAKRAEKYLQKKDFPDWSEFSRGVAEKERI